MKGKLTFIQLKKAKKGFMFVYEGLSKDCENCTYQKVCHNLEAKKVYVVVGLREKEVTCKSSGEKLKLVEVKPAEIRVALEPKYAFEAAIIEFKPQLCKNIECKWFDECVPHILAPNRKYKIVRVGEKFICPQTGKKLVQVFLFPFENP